MQKIVTALLMAAYAFSCPQDSTAADAKSGSNINAIAITEIRSLSAFPESFRKALCLNSRGLCPMADTGEDFNSSDFFYLEDDTPTTRFVYGGLNENSAIVIYERGGYFVTVEGVIFKRSLKTWSEGKRVSLQGIPISHSGLVRILAREAAKT
ncbi:MAG: hypothetical protein QM808_17750 [Steroidobacteraceae bacterium]